jgi:hypothetical protein
VSALFVAFVLLVIMQAAIAIALIAFVDARFRTLALMLTREVSSARADTLGDLAKISAAALEVFRDLYERLGIKA